MRSPYLIGKTPPLPAAHDPQSIAVYGNELIVVNHQSLADSIIIYDLGSAFLGKLKIIGRIPNLPRPTHAIIKDNRLFITCYGKRSTRSESGLYVYEKDPQNRWIQTQKFTYPTIFGLAENTPYKEWPDLGSISIAVENNMAYIANQYSSSILAIDLTKAPEDAITYRMSGKRTRIHYPLALALNNDSLFVADHYFNFIARYTLSSLQDTARPTSLAYLPLRRGNIYHMIALNKRFYVTTTTNKLYYFPLDSRGQVDTKFITLSDGSTLTSIVAYP